MDLSGNDNYTELCKILMYREAKMFQRWATNALLWKIEEVIKL